MIVAGARGLSLAAMTLAATPQINGIAQTANTIWFSSLIGNKNPNPMLGKMLVKSANGTINANLPTWPSVDRNRGLVKGTFAGQAAGLLLSALRAAMKKATNGTAVIRYTKPNTQPSRALKAKAE